MCGDRASEKWVCHPTFHKLARLRRWICAGRRFDVFFRSWSATHAGWLWKASSCLVRCVFGWMINLRASIKLFLDFRELGVFEPSIDSLQLENYWELNKESKRRFRKKRRGKQAADLSLKQFTDFRLPRRERSLNMRTENKLADEFPVIVSSLTKSKLADHEDL